jgi:molybdate transport system substrate-binding protein
MVSEVRLFADKGVILVGPLPAAIQNYTSYMAAVMAGSRNRTEAGAFVRHITTPAARTMFASTGWEF